MPARRIDIRIGRGATPVGELLYDVAGSRETSVFTYYDSWLQHPDRFAIAPDLPLTTNPFYGTRDGNSSVLPGPVADGAPGSWGRSIMKIIAGRQNLTDLDFLIESDDFLRSGALRYFDDQGDEENPLSQPRENGASAPRMIDMEKLVLEVRAFEADPVHYREKRANLPGGELLKQAAGTLGGARPKVSVRDEEGNLWIAKLARMDDLYAVARSEILALRLAERAGLKVCESEIHNTSQKFPVSLIRRFDRGANGSRIPFISGQTFMGLPGTEPSSYVDIADRLRGHGASSGEDIFELWGRMAYSILIQNTDDHLRNHGFLRRRGGWRLSPAFDINPDPVEGSTLKTAISEIHGSALSVEAAVDAAPLFDIRPEDARLRLSEMAAMISASWRDIGSRLGMTSSDFRAVAPAFENVRLEKAMKMKETLHPGFLLRKDALGKSGKANKEPKADPDPDAALDGLAALHRLPEYQEHLVEQAIRQDHWEQESEESRLDDAIRLTEQGGISVLKKRDLKGKDEPAPDSAGEVTDAPDTGSVLKP